MVDGVTLESGQLAQRHVEVAVSPDPRFATTLLRQMVAQIALEKPLKLKLVTLKPVSASHCDRWAAGGTTPTEL